MYAGEMVWYTTVARGNNNNNALAVIIPEPEEMQW
jgi:hypothetical protein